MKSLPSQTTRPRQAEAPLLLEEKHRYPPMRRENVFEKENGIAQELKLTSGFDGAAVQVLL